MNGPSSTRPRAALYARYSTDKQRETSIVDQLRAAEARAAAEGWCIVSRHADEGISGSVPVGLRSGGKALLADALAGRLDVLLIEGLDRLCREIGEQEQWIKRLEHRGIRIVGTADGYDSLARGRKVMRIARGLVNELYLDDLREKVHRGLAGQFLRGGHVGGLSYGYSSRPSADGNTRELVIDEPHAEVVRRIFAWRADGIGARTIVHRLNAEGVPSPRGGTWAVSALVGDSKRGAGLLNNEIYIGRLVWNRRQWLKDPDTGRRRYVDRPAHEWQTREVPHLAIVDADTWAATRGRALSRSGKGASPKTLFAGLLRCPACGGPIVAIDGRRYGCSRHHDRGGAACDNAAAFPRRATEDALLGVVRAELLAPDALAELHAAVRQAAAQAGGGEKARQARQQALQREIERLVDAVAQLGLSEALRGRLRAAEAELAALASMPPAREVSADAVMSGYKRQLLRLREALDDAANREQVRALLADLLGPVTLVRDALGAWAEMEEPVARLALTGSVPVGMVAEARNVSRRRIRIA